MAIAYEFSPPAREQPGSMRMRDQQFTGDVTTSGRPPSADRELASLASNPRFRAMIEESRRSQQEKGRVGLAEIRRDLGLEVGRDDVDPD